MSTYGDYNPKEEIRLGILQARDLYTDEAGIKQFIADIAIVCADLIDELLLEIKTESTTQNCHLVHIVKNSRKYVLSSGDEVFEDGCSECNAYLDEDDNYCSNCGGKVLHV